MWGFAAFIAAGFAIFFAQPALANASAADVSPGDAYELPAYLQCVPYARQVSGIQIYGDAHTWWEQAEGRYARGNAPKVGAVMAFVPHRNMRLGHVAAVSEIIDSRTVLLRHANWSPINGRRGQIENDVRAIDVSPNNDWSEVRVWYHPLQALGKTRWPVHGFIYSDKPSRATNTELVRAETAPARQESSKAFLDAFAGGFEQPKRQSRPAQRQAALSAIY